MKKISIGIAMAAMIAAASTMALAGCGGSSDSGTTGGGTNSATTYAPDVSNAKDGTYTGQSDTITAEQVEEGVDNGDGYGVAKITIKDGKITACDFKTYEPNGTYKGEDYGKEDGEIANRDFYNKAQKANAARDEYSKQLVESGQADCISGATINFNAFEQAVDNAVEQAAK